MDINQIINLLLQLAGLVITALVGQFLHAKQKSNALQQSLDIASQYAKDIVINLSQRSDLTNAEKFKKAFLFVTEKVKKQGLNVTEETITNKIVEAYQIYKKDGGDIHKFIPDFTDQQVTDIQNAVKEQEETITQPQTQVQATPTTQPQDEVKIVSPSSDENKEVVDAPKTDGQVTSETSGQQAPINPYAK